jgi:hypothetical protein
MRRTLTLNEKINVKGEFKRRLPFSHHPMLDTETALRLSFRITGKPLSTLLNHKSFRTRINWNGIGKRLGVV